MVPSFVKLKIFVLKVKSCASVPVPSCKLDKFTVFPFEISKIVPVKETVCASVLSKYPDKSTVVPSFVKLKVFVLNVKSCASVLLPDIHCVPSQENNPFISVS